MSSPRLGLVIATGREETARAVLDRARRAEAAGVEALWTYEDYSFADAFATLGALATATGRARLGTAVTNPFTRNPVLLAMSAATIDRFSGGRMVLGLGRSLDTTIKTQLGIDFGDPYVVLEETIPVLKRLWRGEEVTAEGSLFRLRRARLDNLPCRPDIPVLLAGVGPKALKVAGRVADGVIFHVFASAELVGRNARTFEAAAQEAGRDVSGSERVVLIPLVLARDPEPFREAMRQRVAFLVSIPGNGDVLAAGMGIDPDQVAHVRRAFGTMEMLEQGLDAFTNTRTPERMAAGARELPTGAEDLVSLMGDAAEVRRRMRSYEQAGATSFMLELMTEGIDPDEAIEQLAELRR
ncbi:MAG: LLM class flavin-dependent oxidoreductase [Chloroflexota bacterium]